jgi:hypothetical protein
MITVVDAADLVIDADVDAFIDRLGGPAVVRVPGRDRTRLRVLAGTIHGNEPSGARALHALLRDVVVDGFVPATDLRLVFGALDAARLAPRFTHRMRPGQRDLNRCFRGPFDDDTGRVARAILDAVVVSRVESHVGPRLEAAVDFHNTTGHNPDFIIAGVVDDARAGLASLFSERYLAWRLQLGTFSEVLDEIGVGITFECGRVHDPAADARAVAGARRLASVDVLPVGGRPRQLLRDPVRVRLLAGATVSFGEGDADLVLPGDIDRHNFAVVDGGSVLGRLRDPGRLPLRVDGDDDRDGPDLAARFFGVEGDRLVARVPLVPIMMTTNAAVAMSDCLFYAVRP